MRALCGAVIAAASLIGLGLSAIGIGIRYQTYGFVDANGQERWVPFHLLDTPLIVVVVLLICTLVIGLALAFIGLAYHHHRRHHEMFGSRGVGLSEPRQPLA